MSVAHHPTEDSDADLDVELQLMRYGSMSDDP